eukprot:scaffold645281_cov31-Prasinocladus_malaysianus.AAC.1
MDSVLGLMGISALCPSRKEKEASNKTPPSAEPPSAPSSPPGPDESPTRASQEPLPPADLSNEDEPRRSESSGKEKLLHF